MNPLKALWKWYKKHQLQSTLEALSHACLVAYARGDHESFTVFHQQHQSTKRELENLTS